ncbi:Oidioi.mRNA.OKI2018_I69.PAR.g10244.t1.cds [Oikopleura dioica]|uniref:Oidioi.mRNA.OKI2018_I69.PAR.g10244.t1.cds n=1 Tax=Oikopleura dioica TaxID=34765 RepID=A0ABN7RPQ4_OIKDI|nr:Oidioi.mRNA.OKI2018_I69.PAR.g10244.t1.cds [Oikopleura dioica]
MPWSKISLEEIRIGVQVNQGEIIETALEKEEKEYKGTLLIESLQLFASENDVRFDLSEDFKNQEFQLCVDKFVESMVAADEFGKYPTEDQISGTIRVYGPSQINEKFETIIGELRWTISLMTVPAEKPKEPVKKVEKPKARRVTRVRIKPVTNPDVPADCRQDPRMANSIVSQAGMEEIEVLVHGASNLFKPGKERLPPRRAQEFQENSRNRKFKKVSGKCILMKREQRAFVSFKSESDFDNNVPAKSSTTVARKSSAPIWAEVVQLKFKANQEITAILSIIDYDSKAVLSKFKIPSQRLQPFQQYHLELVDKDTSCFVSIRRKQHLCPEKSLEFVLCEMSDEINDNELDGFTAIFRPISDILHYRESYMQLIFEGQNRNVIDFQPIDLFSETPRSPSDSPVGFPQAIPMSFRVAKASLTRHSWWHNVILTPRHWLRH